MQVYETNLIDARSFPQIWATMTASERDDLAIQLYAKKCCKTRQTVWNWANGKKQPNSPLVIDTVAKVVSKAVGSRVLGRTLFPSRQ